MTSTPDDVRTLARAAAMLAALTHPDVAAVVAAMPRRPGEPTTLVQVREATDLDVPALGRAIARARDAGVLAVDGDRLVLDAAGPRAAVDALVARTPLGAALADRPSLLAQAPYGVVAGVPSGDGSVPLLEALAALLPSGELTEPRVTAALSVLGDDPVGLRRALVDAGLLWRTADGAVYQRQDER